jgi:hypothetical protein
MALRNRDGTPWVWWIGVRLLLLAAASTLGFRYAFGLTWPAALGLVCVSFGLAGAVWGVFAWMAATGRQIPLPERLLLAIANRAEAKQRDTDDG